MFLSFLAPLPGRSESMLINVFADTIGSTHIMEFPDVKPEYSGLNEVLIGYSWPVSSTAWEFNTVGSGTIHSNDDSDAKAIEFFVDIYRAITDETNSIEDQMEAHAIFARYVEEVLAQFFEGEEFENVKASRLSPEDTLTLIDETIAAKNSTMH